MKWRLGRVISGSERVFKIKTAQGEIEKHYRYLIPVLHNWRRVWTLYYVKFNVHLYLCLNKVLEPPNVRLACYLKETFTPHGRVHVTARFRNRTVPNLEIYLRCRWRSRHVSRTRMDSRVTNWNLPWSNSLTKVTSHIAEIEKRFEMHVCAEYACKKLPRALDDLIRDVAAHFHRSHKRQKQFEKLQEILKLSTIES